MVVLFSPWGVYHIHVKVVRPGIILIIPGLCGVRGRRMWGAGAGAVGRAWVVGRMGTQFWLREVIGAFMAMDWLIAKGAAFQET